MQVETCRKFVILDRDFSMEAGEMTPTLKMKRKEIEIKHKSLLDKLYDDNSFGENLFPNKSD